jgi:hypothetical protein
LKIDKWIMENDVIASEAKQSRGYPVWIASGSALAMTAIFATLRHYALRANGKW